MAEALKAKKNAQNTAELPSDLPTITAEINTYKRIAGEAIFEIGRRLKHVKENDLAHGEFGKWLEEVEIDRTLATRLMKIAEELGGEDYATWHKLSQRVLYEISTLPESERDKTHTTAKGEEKTPVEITVKENDLAHGEFERWVSDELDFTPRNARRYMKVFDRFESKRTRVSEIPFGTLNLLTTFTVELPLG